MLIAFVSCRARLTSDVDRFRVALLPFASGSSLFGLNNDVDRFLSGSSLFGLDSDVDRFRFASPSFAK